jgi:hypothetical protein
MLFTLLLLAALAACGVFIQMQQREQDQLRLSLRRYDSLASREETERQLDLNISLKRSELGELERKQGFVNNQIRELQHKLRELEAKTYLQSIDSYEPRYDFISSGDYILRLENIKLQQERMRKNNQAFICDTQWKIGEGRSAEKEGKKMTDELLKLVEFSFETQCKYTLKEVRYNNVDKLKQKINKSFDKINRYLKKINCRISSEYLKLKLIELDLQYELEDKKKEEKDREQELKRQAREHEAIEKARQKAEEAEEREKLHQQELDKVREEIEQVAQAEVEKRKQLELQIQQLERQIAEDRRDKENANKVKWGYIYIISNIGSLGRDIYRICMTRSNNPDEYIRDMKPVVPFEFDKHFKIFSEDVFDTLDRLNERFADKRVNLVNSRREFFKVSIDEIEQAVKEIARETDILRIDEIERAPQAYEYRQTLATRKKNQHLTPDDSYLGEDEIA